MTHVLPIHEKHIHDLFTVCPCKPKVIIIEEKMYVEHIPFMQGIKTFRQLVLEETTNLDRLWIKVTLN